MLFIVNCLLLVITETSWILEYSRIVGQRKMSLVIPGASYFCYDRPVEPYGIAGFKTRNVAYFKSNGSHIVTVGYKNKNVMRTRLDPTAGKPVVSIYTIRSFLVDNHTYQTNFIMFYDNNHYLITGSEYCGKTIPPTQQDLELYQNTYHLASAMYFSHVDGNIITINNIKNKNCVIQ